MNFEIVGVGADAVGVAPGVRVAFQGPGVVKMFRRRAIRVEADGRRRDFEALVAELDGVRAYVRNEGGTLVIILSREDLYP